MNNDYKVMKKYKNGGDIAPADFEILRNAASVGNVRFGFTVRNGEIIPQAKLTDSGKFFLKLDKKQRRSKISRVATAIIESIF